MGKISLRKINAILDKQGFKCAICQIDLHRNREKIHCNQYAQISQIKPKSLGGSNNESNLRALCKSCNSTRTNLSGVRLVNLILSDIEKANLARRKHLLIDDIKTKQISYEDLIVLEKSINNFNEDNLNIIKQLKNLTT